MKVEIARKKEFQDICDLIYEMSNEFQSRNIIINI